MFLCTVADFRCVFETLNVDLKAKVEYCFIDAKPQPQLRLRTFKTKESLKREATF